MPTKPSRPLKYLTTAEVADVLRLTTWQVVNLCRSKKLPATKPSGQWLIAEEDLDAFLAAAHNQAEGVA